MREAKLEYKRKHEELGSAVAGIEAAADAADAHRQVRDLLFHLNRSLHFPCLCPARHTPPHTPD